MTLDDIADRWFRQLWQQGDWEGLDRLHAPHFVDRTPGPGRAPDNAGFKKGIREFYEAFPDFRAEIDHTVVDDEARKIAIRWTASATHIGPYLGFAPTRKRIAFAGIEILRVEDDLVVERWGEWDGLGLRAQLSSGA